MRTTTALPVLVVSAALVLLLLTRIPVTADEPVSNKPQWQRQLQGEAARRAETDETKLRRFQEEGKLEEALKIAEGLVTLRQREQGADHWETVTARSTLDAIRCALQQDDKGRKEYLGTYSLERQAAALIFKGKHKDAQPLLETVLAIRRKILGEDHAYTAVCYCNVAYNLNALGRYADATSGLAKGLAIYRKVFGEEHPATAVAYGNLAFNLNSQGKYAEAAPGLAKALAIQRRVMGEEHPFTAICYSNVAFNLNNQAKYTEAAVGYAKALNLHRKVLGEEDLRTAASYNNLATNLDAQGKYEAATEGFTKALAIQLKVLGENHPQTAATYSNLAVNMRARGKDAEAAENLAKALAISRKVLGEEHPQTAAICRNLAASQANQRKYADAAANFAKVLSTQLKQLGEEHPETAGTYSDIAGNYGAEGRYALAVLNYQKALAIRAKVLGEEHPLMIHDHNGLGHSFYALGRYAEAEDHWLRAADSFARARLRLASSGLERATKTGELSPLSPLAALLARRGKFEAAWQRFEESQARGTWDDLSARLRRPGDVQARQIELAARLNSIDQRIVRTFTAQEPTPQQLQARNELLTQRRLIQDEFDTFAGHLEKTYGPAAGQVFDRARLQKALAADTALVGWVDVDGFPKAVDPNGEHWAVLLRGSGAPVWVRLRGSGPGGAWTEADTVLPKSLRAALVTRRGNWKMLAQRLRGQRLEPLAKYLAAQDGQPRIRNLLVLPAIALPGVPVEVFAEDYTVSYALSGTLHAHLHESPRRDTSGLLAVADPVFELPRLVSTAVDLPPALRGGEQAWEPLPGTRLEVEGLRRLFDNSAAKVLVGAHASEQEVHELARRGSLGRFRYLHFATHGEFDDRWPLASALILSRDALPDPAKQLDAGLPIFDGRLTAEKVLRHWKLHSELVTLSACETALGRYERGEGFVGFAQALILAGSRAVVLSQWKVDDTATALLMDRFYQNLLGKRAGLTEPMGKAAALTEAKQWLRTLSSAEATQRTVQLRQGVARAKDRPVLPPPPAVPPIRPELRDAPPYAHPYYWAAFVLVGDPR